MNLYYVTLWDPDKGKNGESAHLRIVAPTSDAALREVRKYKGEMTDFKLALTGLIVV